MRKFPPEFADLLTPHGRDILNGESESARALSGRSKKSFVILEDLIEKGKADCCSKLLDNHIYPLLVPIRRAIPRESISGMKENYGEVLTKTVRAKTAYLKKRSARSFRAAEEIGLLDMMGSESFIRFVESVSGLALDHSDWHYQVLCYEQGDYAGPHNDHHPENDDYREGFVDFHIMFSNEAVAHHWLVYQSKWHFSEIANINLQGAVSVYKLPFWHYTTPLAAKPGREREARRWLLLGTFRLLR
ncbi:MAG TPA: hypothetical protein VKC34_14095 [Blastocatellia bacterium]|nr:hypothetical protein [Blastocatellia bacterium]